MNDGEAESGRPRPQSARVSPGDDQHRGDALKSARSRVTRLMIGRDVRSWRARRPLSATEDGGPRTEDRTPNTEHRTPSIEDRTPGTEHRALRPEARGPRPEARGL